MTWRGERTHWHKKKKEGCIERPFPAESKQRLMVIVVRVMMTEALFGLSRRGTQGIEPHIPLQWLSELAETAFVGTAGMITVDTRPTVLASGICLVISEEFVWTQPWHKACHLPELRPRYSNTLSVLDLEMWRVAAAAWRRHEAKQKSGETKSQKGKYFLMQWWRNTRKWRRVMTTKKNNNKRQIRN